MDLGSWLRTLGLERFEGPLRENAIDETVLSDLTEDHLRELGLPFGARIKLLKAIKALSSETAIGASAEKAVSGSPSDAAERRQISVMFSDLVGSTALSTRMDPEDLRKLISTYQKAVTETVQRYGGFVAKYMGGNTWAMVCSCISVTRRLTRTMPREREVGPGPCRGGCKIEDAAADPRRNCHGFWVTYSS